MRITGGDTDAPAVVRYAFWAWVVAAAIGLLDAVLLWSVKNSLVDQAIKNNKDPAITADQIKDGANNLVMFMLITSVVFAALYVYFAYRARAGVKSARTTLVVVGIVHLLLCLLIPVSLYVLVAVLLSIVGGALLYVPRPARDYYNPER
jgi:heme/copper-type cytochrome/quinol oxidase subunit 2